MKKGLVASLALMGFISSSSILAASVINLRQQPVSILQTLQFKEINRSVDTNHMLHVRIQQMYAGYPVWGADAVLHIPQGESIKGSLASIFNAAKQHKSFMNGFIYQQLSDDLGKQPTQAVLNQKQKVLQHAISLFEGNRKLIITNPQSELMIYIDQQKRAHWAYQVTFDVDAIPAKPVYIIDALSETVYEHWDNLQTLESVHASGFGGNIRMGKLVYDNLADHRTELMIQRDNKASICYMQNSLITVSDFNTQKVITFPCEQTSLDHNNSYWHDTDAVNDGYSPSNDVLYAGEVVSNMYKEWYGIPILKNSDGTEMKLQMVVHFEHYDNAYWDGIKMTFGDGDVKFYPLTSIGLVAHEASHGFTMQHSHLVYENESGGMNEAFSDMAGQTVDLYAYGQNNWELAAEVYKPEGRALRYMDQPSKNCFNGQQPGDHCSIDTYSQYSPGMNVHNSSGLYNHVFYLMSKTPGWDAQKAFKVMIKANMVYWTANSTFSEGACGVIQAAKDYEYEIEPIKTAFNEVEIKTDHCN